MRQPSRPARRARPRAPRTSRRCRRRTGSWRSRSATTPWASPRSATRLSSRPSSRTWSASTGAWSPGRSRRPRASSRTRSSGGSSLGCRGYAARRCGRGPRGRTPHSCGSITPCWPSGSSSRWCRGTAGWISSRASTCWWWTRAGWRPAWRSRPRRRRRATGRRSRTCGTPARRSRSSSITSRSTSTAPGRSGCTIPRGCWRASRRSSRRTSPARWRRWRSRPATSTASPSAGPSARARTSRRSPGRRGVHQAAAAGPRLRIASRGRRGAARRWSGITPGGARSSSERDAVRA